MLFSEVFLSNENNSIILTHHISNLKYTVHHEKYIEKVLTFSFLISNNILPIKSAIISYDYTVSYFVHLICLVSLFIYFFLLKLSFIQYLFHFYHLKVPTLK